MATSPHHAYQKLGEAFRALATAPEGVRFRLARAHEVLRKLTPEHFPPYLRGEFQEIMAALNKYPPPLVYDGTVFRPAPHVTFHGMQNRTGVKIAKQIVRLYYRLEQRSPLKRR
jgi:hypothetical protein